jgi:hypothetical protein
VHRAREPALVIERTLAEHCVELSFLARCVRVGECGRETLALDRALGVSLDHLGGFDAEQLIDRWWHVDRVDVLVADLLGRLDLRRPGDNAHVGDAALVARPALPVRKRRVQRPGPAGVVVVARRGGAELVDAGHCPRGGGRHAVVELPFVERAVGAAFAAGPIVGHRDDERVVELTRLLEVVDDPPDPVVEVRDEAGEHFGHPREETLLVIGDRDPGSHGVQRRPRFAIR